MTPRRGWVIGLTGGTGAGKSALAARLRRLGAAYYSVDRAAHDVYRPGTPVQRALARRFGPAVVSASGGIDRARLGAAAFGSAAGLAALDRIVHPELARMAGAAVRRLASRHPLVAVEAGAILFALGLDRLCDRVVIARAPVAVRLRRLTARGMDRREARRRLAALAGVERAMERRAAGCRRAIRVDLGGPVSGLRPLAARLAARAV